RCRAFSAPPPPGAAEQRDQLSHRVRRGAQQPAPGRLLDAPAYGQCPRCEQRWLRLLFPAQLELPTCYASARRPILSTDATAVVVRRSTRVGRTVAQGKTWKNSQ